MVLHRVLHTFLEAFDPTREALKVKHKYQTVMSLAATITSSIEGGGEWDWANNEKQLGNIKTMTASLTDLSDFCRSMLTQELKDLKKKYTTDAYADGLKEFAALDSKLSVLAKRLASIQAMHRAAHM